MTFEGTFRMSMEMEIVWFFLVGVGVVYYYARADTILLILFKHDFMQEV